MCEAGENWTKVADLLGITRKMLLAANNEPTGNPSNLTAGRIVHFPPL